MTDDNIELTRRKLLASAGALGVAGAGAGIGTNALYTDEESFADNVMTAGTLNLSVSVRSVAANDEYEAAVGAIDYHEEADGEIATGFDLADVKPGDWAIFCVDLEIQENPGCVTVTTSDLANDDNGHTEPESDVDDTDGDGEGELAQNMLAEVYSDFDGSVDSDDPRDYLSGRDDTTPMGTSLAEFYDTYNDDEDSSGVTVGGGTAFNTTSFYLLLWLPSSVGNVVQTDSVSWDTTFDAVQARHNDSCNLPSDDECACPDTDVDTSAEQSSAVTVQSTDASSFPDISTFLDVDTAAGNAGDLTASDFALAEDDCGQEISVEFTSEDKPVDLVFLMDVTGSMGGELDTMKTNVQDFIDSVEAEGIDARYALYLFGDEESTGPPAVFLKQDFTSDSTTFKNAVQDTSLEEEVGYGGDRPEDNYEAILTADNDLTYRSGAQRVMVDITDAPSEEDPDQTIGGLAETRANAAMVLDDYTYIAVSPDETGTHEKKTLASNVDGTWIEILEDLDPILDDIVTEVTTSYRIRYTTACPEADGTTRDVVIEITDPDAGTLYATTSYTAPSS